MKFIIRLFFSKKKTTPVTSDHSESLPLNYPSSVDSPVEEDLADNNSSQEDYHNQDLQDNRDQLTILYENLISLPDTPTIYRVEELKRIMASIQSAGSLLVVGDQGSGKTFLAQQVYKAFLVSGFSVAFIEPCVSTKQLLLRICNSFNIPTHDLQGKNLTTEQLKQEVEIVLKEGGKILIFDDAQQIEIKIRFWLKNIVQFCPNSPILLFANSPKRGDLFLSVPRIYLDPLSDKTIRKIMKAISQERSIKLDEADLAYLQQRVGGNPMLALRVLQEEYLGLDFQEGDHQRYGDGSFLIFVGLVTFIGVRFFAIGLDNRLLYALSGLLAVLFWGFYRSLRLLPGEGAKIR
ncbi:ATP-binding protein [Cylindrospermopsis raciborskii]|uniref:ATP-binding protein n=1 Tax=Cylindrospermopsis raciborskii TaxID=77022 RepID=UPI0022C31D45|nr:ATP-binding protein [Cylindrospermopsis raciborskii]MCZ2207583.1 ATP-binding protein [Cylindrospermopsis raciborskii PAMP2011]